LDPSDLLSADEAWEYLGVSRATLWKLIARYKIPRYQLPLKGKRIFLKRADLDRLREPIRRDGEEKT
jgi:excisionase family DNA binding protein